MTKEAKSYIKNVMHGRDFIVDCISAVCAFAVLFLVAINSFGDNAGSYYTYIFSTGALLAFLNCYKKLRARSSFAIAFLTFGFLMAVAAYLCYRM